MEDLFEQLDRMKDLMVYENGMSIDEVSTSRGNIPTPDTKTDNTKEKKEGGNEETKPSSENTKSEGENCFLIKASGEFVVNVNKGSKAVSNFIINLENSIKNNPSFDRSKVKDGSMYITEITLQGFASNYYNGAVEPDFDNGWCKKWDKRGGLYDGLCTDWEIKPFSGKKKSSYSGNKTTNQKLASDRAVNAYNALKEKLTEKVKEEGIKVDPNLKPKYIKGGTIFTNDNVDENWKTRISQGKTNPGQVVLCTAKVCYSLNEEEEECSDKCMVKKDGKCICPEEKGLKEVDGKCVCIKTNKEPDENCECKEEPEPKKCPDPCMKLNKENNCECPSDMEYDKEKEECVCKDENKVKVPGGCKCENKRPPLKCDYNKEKEGVRGTKENNYVGASLKTSFPVGANNSITIDFDSVVVPDAFYVKYGDQEYWSGFMGSVYDNEYKMIALSIEERKKIFNILPPNIRKMIEKSISEGDNDYSQMTRGKRNFAGELIYYKQNEGLISSINSAISNVGGKLKVDNVFDGGDQKAETITKKIIDGGISYKDGLDSYGNIMKRNVSFTIDKEQENYELVVLVFSPLDRTIFKMKVNCQ